MSRQARGCGLLWFVSVAVLLTSGYCGMAAEPAAGDSGAKSARHWAFRPIVRPAVPQVRSTGSLRTPIDAFIVSRLEQAGLELSPAASRTTLIRRLSLDFLGLPPSPNEIDTFLADETPGGAGRLVDRLLASPHYGEAWGRKWLDLVRYAETAGFNADPERPLAWKYRDYVIRAFNAKQPYSQFLGEQLAGDELAPDSAAALTATGYLRMWPDESNASDVLLARQDALNDLTANVGAVFLGLTLGCAQCHDHKFDPVTQDDFYSLQSFFAGLVPVDSVALGTHAQLDRYQQQLDAWRAEVAEIRDRLHAIETSARARAAHIKRLKFPQVVLDAIDTAPEKRTAMQHQLAFWSERQIVLKAAEIEAKLSDADKAERKQLQSQWKSLQRNRPRPPRNEKIMAAVEIPAGPPETFLLGGGSYSAPLYEVEPAFVAAANNSSVSAVPRSPRRGASGRRTTLVDWLTDRSNPLTARVMVNRIWQGFFGRGLVAGGSDFGTRSPPPTHPLLLDWLADEFMRSGWNVAHMQRLIVDSAVYRQAARRVAVDDSPAVASADGDGPSVDPGNRLYWHFPRRRLTAEQIRDGLLAASGLLCEEMYGPGVRPELPPNFSARARWKVSESASDRQRRSIYIFAKRNLPYPLLQVFDLPDMHESCARRAETTVAPQSLMLLNSQLVQKYAKELARRVLREADSTTDAARIDLACRLVWGRLPDQAEAARMNSFLQRSVALSQAAAEQAESGKADGGQNEGGPADSGAADESRSGGLTPAEQTALIDLCHALLNTNAFLFVE